MQSQLEMCVMGVGLLLVRLCSSFYEIHVHDTPLSAWSLTYLFLHLRRSLRTPRNPLSLTLAGGTAVCASLYGTEYFMFQS